MFHLRDGFYFVRGTDGSVTIRVCESGHSHAPVTNEVTVPANEWASVIASVCADGETSETYRDALDFHTAHRPDPNDGLVRGLVPGSED